MFYVDVTKVKGKMGERGYTNTALANALNISRNTLAAYFLNPAKIPYEILERMAETLFDDVEEARAVLFAQKLA